MTRSKFIVLISLCALVALSLFLTGCNKVGENTTPETNIKTEENTKTPDSADKTPENTSADLTADGETETPSTTAVESEIPDTGLKFPDYNGRDVVCFDGGPGLDSLDVAFKIAVGFTYDRSQLKEYIMSDKTHSDYLAHKGKDYSNSAPFSLFLWTAGMPEGYKMTEEGMETYNSWKKLDNPKILFRDYLECFDKNDFNWNDLDFYKKFYDDSLNIGVEKLEAHLDELRIPHKRVSRAGELLGVNVIVTLEQIDLLVFDDVGICIEFGNPIRECKNGVIKFGTPV